MRVNYKGMDSDYNYRIAEICFDDENKNEVKTMNDLVILMKIHGGYNIDIVSDGYACAEVDDYEDYKEFVRLYKGFKHDCAMWRKFGH